MISLINKFKHSLRGLYIMLRYDRSMQLHVLFLVVTFPLLHLLFSPFSNIEYMFLIVAYGILFVTELQNSALETALDHLHPERHESVRDSKDIASASVLTGLLIFLGLILVFMLERGIF